MYINNNISAINSQRHVNSTNKALDKTLERLSSGLRINSGADDASGLAIAKKMSAQNAGLGVANQNAQDGQALYKIADGALEQVSAMLTRMEELAVRATNGTLTTTDRQAVLDEVNELRDQINKISSTTEYNTLKVLDGSMSVKTSLAFTGTNQDSLSILTKPGTMQNGTGYSFHITSVASMASMAGGAATTSSAVAGTVNVNGVDISVAQGDTVAALAAKINAVNSQTDVVAMVSSTGTLQLVSGVLDTDAQNIDTSITDSSIVGYALVGTAQSIVLNGNGAIWTSFGMTGATSAFGTNASGSFNGVAAKCTDGYKLEDTQYGSGTYGMTIATDQYNSGAGIYLRKGQASITSAAVHRSTAGDSAVLGVDVDDRLRIQIGANYDQAIYNGIENMSTSQLGIGGSSKYGSLDSMKLDTADHANLSLKVIQQAIVDVTSARSQIGASMNRLDYTISTLAIQQENMTAAQSRIEDADISAEMTTFTKQQIMLQAGTAMLAQANSRPQAVLQLLQ